MNIKYTRHALKKFADLAVFGIKVTKTQIDFVVNNPKYQTSDNGIEIVAKEFDAKHNLRVVFKKTQNGIIIITFYIYRKGRYEEY